MFHVGLRFQTDGAVLGSGHLDARDLRGQLRGVPLAAVSRTIIAGTWVAFFKDSSDNRADRTQRITTLRVAVYHGLHDRKSFDNAEFFEFEHDRDSSSRWAELRAEHHEKPAEVFYIMR